MKSVDLKYEKFVFSWEKLDDADAYTLRYRLEGESEFKNIASTTGKSYDISKRTDIISNPTVYFQVVAYKDTEK